MQGVGIELPKVKLFVMCRGKAGKSCKTRGPEQEADMLSMVQRASGHGQHLEKEPLERLLMLAGAWHAGP